jgi:hypothetical protein
MASRTRVLLLAFTMLVFTVAAFAPAIVRAQEYSVSLTVTGLPTGVGTHYYVDNVLNGTIQTGETKSLNFTMGGAHTVSVDLYVNVGNETRYQCGDNVWSFTEGGIHPFAYKAQYHLEVLSPYGSPTGTDWYDEGATVYARLVTNVTAGAEGVRYVFVSWKGDASGQGIVSDPIIMDRAKKATAGWKTQYILRISSDPISIFSPLTLWFDEGSLADFSAPPGTNGTDTRYVFDQWFGDCSGANARASLQMDGPKSITAKYKTQYFLNVTLTPPEIAQRQDMPTGDWYDPGQITRLGPVSHNITVSSMERLTLLSWNLDGMTQPGTSMEIQMESPHRVELTYRREYYLNVTSRFGETKGTGWYPSGQTVRFSVTYGGPDYPVKNIFVRWKSSPSTATIADISKTETDITMDRPYVMEAEWTVDYTPVWVTIFVIVSAVTLIAAVIITAVKRPGFYGRFTSSVRSLFRDRKVRIPTVSPTPWVVCHKCGARVASSAEYCQTCGATQARRRPAATPDTETLDERVYDYIVKRRGEISLSRASRDLGLSVDEIRRSTERLKKRGRLA